MRRGSRIVTDKSCLRRLFPVLRQEFVASSVLSAIKDGREQLILPRTLSMVSALLHLLPTPLYDVIVSLAGGSHGMNGFRRDWPWGSPPIEGGGEIKCELCPICIFDFMISEVPKFQIP